MLRPLVKTHGGKFFLRHFIISHFPVGYEQMTYVEPFLGGGSILLNKKPSIIEIGNDLDSLTANLWQAVRNPYTFATFFSRLINIKYNDLTFHWAKTLLKYNASTTPLDYSIAEYVCRRMSRGGMKKSFAKSNRLRGGKMGDENAWDTAVKELPKIAERIKEMFIFNQNAIKIIEHYDSIDTLIYCDPPYLHSTRVSKQAYTHEMSEKDHEELLDTLLACKAKVIISGYDSTLYCKKINHWTKHVKQIANHASQKKVKRIKEEIIWKNF